MSLRLWIPTLLFVFVFMPKAAKAEDIGFSVRALGMGNAYTAIVNDSDSIFYNPAGLGKMKGFNWNILDLGLGANKVESYQDFLDVIEDSSDVSTIINELYGKEVSVYLGGKSILSIGGFSFGAYGLSDLNLQVNNPVYPNINSQVRLDLAYVAGWGMELVPDILHVGLLGRRVVRQGGRIPIGVSTIANLNSQAIVDELSRKGLGYAVDFGATVSLPGVFRPTLSYTWRDVGNTTFRPTGSELPPQAVEQEQILGFGATFESTLMDIRPAVDFRHLTATQIPFGQRLNFGIEFSWPILDVRGGFHQGYYTLGAGFDLWLMRVDAATYGVELGQYPGQLEDRRYMLQLTFEFGVDPGNFSFLKLERPSVRQHGRKLRR